MKITVESTSRLIHVNGVEARQWEGRTCTGHPVTAFITRLTVTTEGLDPLEAAALAAELCEVVPPTDASLPDAVTVEESVPDVMARVLFAMAAGSQILLDDAWPAALTAYNALMSRRQAHADMVRVAGEPRQIYASIEPGPPPRILKGASR